MIKLTIVVPCFNEEQCLPVFRKEYEHFAAQLTDPYCTDLVLVDDGSSDHTWEIISSWAAENPAVSGYLLSRNFGQQSALTCGYEHADGDLIVSMDADLQDDFSVIYKMIAEWEEGADIVYAVRASRKKEGVFKCVSAWLFYRLMHLICKTNAPLDTGDFRLMSRQSLNALLCFPERSRMLRAMIGWCGFKTARVQFDRKPRSAGETKYTLSKMLLFAFDGIFSFSALPLRLSYVFSGLFLLICFCYLVYVCLAHFFWNEPLVRGWTSLIIILTGSAGINLLCFGLIGEYISRIFDEVKQRPLYLVARDTVTPQIRRPDPAKAGR